MAKAMKQMGIKQDEIKVNQVIFKMDDGEIIFENPSVQEIEMGSEKNYQISGENRFEANEEIIEITDEDIKTVSEQCNINEEKAEELLMDAEGDIAQAILNFQSKN